MTVSTVTPGTPDLLQQGDHLTVLMLPSMLCAAFAKLTAKPWDWLAKKTPFRGSYMFSTDYVDELAVRVQGGARQGRGRGCLRARQLGLWARGSGASLNCWLGVLEPPWMELLTPQQAAMHFMRHTPADPSLFFPPLFPARAAGRHCGAVVWGADVQGAEHRPPQGH